MFNPKAKQWVVGRKNIFEKIKSTIQSTDTIAWFHCASLGEFEQGKPVIEGYKTKYPEHKILITFFSPSGYELRKDYSGADYIFYLPIDSYGNAKRFVEMVQPKKAFFIKYEFWFFYLQQLSINKIPTYLISGVLRKNQVFFKWYGVWYRKMLHFFSHFYVQNEVSKKLLTAHGFNNVTLSGDTRFDRVYENSLHPEKMPILESFKANNNIIIGGSSWPTEEKILAEYFSKQGANFKLIIAPHDVSKNHVQQIESLFKNKCIKYSEATEQNVVDKKVLIIDSIGILANAYQYANVAFIGGGFTGALHNILEPCSYGNLVLFGPHHRKFHEAQGLINSGGAFVVSNASELEAIIEQKQEALSAIKEQNKAFIVENKGASSTILNHL